MAVEAATPEGNMYCAYGSTFAYFFDEISGLLPWSPPYLILTDWWNLIAMSYGFVGLHYYWARNLFRAVEIYVPDPPNQDIQFLLLSPAVVEDFRSAAGYAWDLGQVNVEFFRLPGVQGGAWPDMKDVSWKEGYFTLLKWPSAG